MSTIQKRLATDSTLKDVAAAISNVANAIAGQKKAGVVYAFHIDGAEADPDARVTYLKDALGMTPAKMNYSTGKFDWGSWEDAFFIPRPCMLKYDGTVDYYLDTENYSLKENGEVSDVADLVYGGNAMMEWGANGIIWYKVVPDENDTTSGTFYIADHKVDDGFVCWPFFDSENNLIPRFYTPIYTGTIDGDGRLRSISGQAPTTSTTTAQEVAAALLNNAGSEIEWYTEVLADVTLINLLLVLIGKSTDTQTIFGQGHTTGASSAAGLTPSGSMDSRGLFWGTNANTTSGVKVFGMENWWGNYWRRYAGHILDAGVQKIKLTYGKADGTTAIAYNTTGSGYKTIANATPTGTSGGYIKTARIAQDGIFPFDVTGQDGQHYSDGMYFTNSSQRYALRGGVASGHGRLCGAFCVDLGTDASYAGWNVGAALSCKPVSREGE